ncbi:MAG: N-formylglutamate amidohydrolase [Thermoanaerobaculia bacterium]|nr:MAG: N-formylglutamate amidohydrolase [Thermoanaerobaculia bacterium]
MSSPSDPTPARGPFEVAEVEDFGAADGAPSRVLIEVPHGATRRADFEALRAHLRGELPPGLEAYFHVNTDEGAPELALETARRLAALGVASLVLRCRVPRTLIDVNRVVEGEVAAGMSAGLPPYVRDETDRRLLLDLHARYQREARRLYDEVCGAGGLALALHTYAPRAVEIEVGDDVVAQLRRAYRPARYARWELRPEIDLITGAGEGGSLAPPGLPSLLWKSLASAGIEVAENRSYSLHPATTGFTHSSRWPGQVLCLEVRRDLLGAPWRPFVESRIGSRKVARVARVLAACAAAHVRAHDGARFTR